MNFWRKATATTAFIALGLVELTAPGVLAAPSAEVAKRCLHYAYVVYPWKRPGAVPMSGDRQAYFRDCMGKNGEVPAPAGPAQAGSQNPAPDPAAASKATSSDPNPPPQTSH
jgi:hypothetical protein